MKSTDLEVLWREFQHYFEFFEEATEAYVVTDPGGVIEEANGAAVDVLQRRRRYLRGRPLAAMIALDHRATFRQHLQCLARGEPQPSWKTVIESPGLRTDATLTPRVIVRSEGVGGITWLLQAAP